MSIDQMVRLDGRVVFLRYSLIEGSGKNKRGEARVQPNFDALKSIP